MGWAQNKVAAYEQMIVQMRRLIAGENGSTEEVPKSFLADLDQIVTTTEVAVAGGYLPFGPTPAVEMLPADLARPSAKRLARWLWDRNLTVHDAAHQPQRVAAAAGVENLAPQTWIIVADLMAKMESRAEREPDSPTVARNHLNDRAQWAGLPAVVPDTETPADPFRHGSTAEANRKAKAKQLARWLWDRGIDGATLLGFTDKYRREIARAAGVNPPSSLATWQVVTALIAKMEVKLAADPDLAAVVRHHLDEHDGWVTDPHAVPVG